MCGIAGWFSPDPVSPSSQQQLESMVNTIRHRGPDGRGTLIDGHAALGHARLAIIDLDSGYQPMTDPEGQVRIVYNGEIYNYKELRRELIGKGYSFKTHSDTEVILNLYIDQGRAAFSRLRGMYALAIWDRRSRTGLLVRDTIGIKPLFYRPGGKGEIVFASEAKAILARDVGSAELDEGSLHLLMNFRYIPGDATLFREIKQLSPGTVLEWQIEGPPREFAIEAPGIDPSDDVLEALRESVEAHLTADVEVAAYLSGGMDSAAIAALAAGGMDGRLRSFTLNIGDDPDEAQNAARTAAILGIDNSAEDGSPQVERSLPRLIWHLELPKINAFQVSELAKYTSRHVKVALSGLGGDELFFGYNAHRIMHLMQRAHSRIPGVISGAASRLGLACTKWLGAPPWSEPERAARMAGSLGDWPRVYGLLRNAWDDPAMRRRLYGPRLLDAQLPNAFDRLAELWPDDPDPVLATAKFEWRHKMVNDLLWQEDRCSMAEGLEVRVPFLDVKFAASVRALSRDRLMARGQRKGFMRETLRRILPDEILNRRKSGFQVDAPRFFETHLAALANEMLSEERVRDYGLFNPAFVNDVRRRGPRKSLRWHYFVLYLMLTTHLWVELFERGSHGLEPSWN